MSDSPGRLARLVDATLEATVVGSFTALGYQVRSRLEHWRDPEFARGRLVVVTGATSGLGLATAQRLASLGADLALVGRSEAKLEAARHQVVSTASGSVETYRCDLSQLRETGELVKTLGERPIDVLIHNAGALLGQFTRSDEGVETTLAVHLLSPYLLTEGLVGDDGFAPGARVISMTSGGMYTERFDLANLEMSPGDYRGSVAYARAKRAQTILNEHWQEVYGPRGLAFHMVHPGWADTPGVTEGLPGFARYMSPFLRTPEQGADCAVWLAGGAPGEPTPGLLWHDRHPRSLHKLRRTRLDEVDEVRARNALPVWCRERIDRALTSD